MITDGRWVAVDDRLRVAEALNEECGELWRKGVLPRDPFMTDQRFQKHREAWVLGRFARRVGWSTFLAEHGDGKNGIGADFRLWYVDLATGRWHYFDVEISEVLDANRRRNSEYGRPYDPRARDLDFDDFRPPDFARLIGKKVRKMEQGRYTQGTTLLLYNNSTTIFYERPTDCDHFIANAVTATGAGRAFGGVWTLGGVDRVAQFA